MGTADLYRDIAAAVEKFPKLQHVFDERLHSLSGCLDICDTVGEYRGSFEIQILLPETFPYGVPLVKELSTVIPREKNRHISEGGECCLDIEHNLLYIAKNGIKLVDFITEKVYPFFANQVFFGENRIFASGEYLHGFDGVIQFYKEELKTDVKLSIEILECILADAVPDKYSKCVCGLRRFDKCHFAAIEFLKNIGTERLQKDLDGFLAIQSKAA